MRKNKNIMGNMNILIYDDNNIVYYHCTPTNITSEPRILSIQSAAYGDIEREVLGNDIYIQTSNIEELNNIQLDETTMKRIAKFNKQQECKKLDKEIEDKKEKIKELDNLLQDKEKRWGKVKDFIKNIYEIDIDDDEDEDEYYYNED